ncbi:choice-of-anchor D domain-containing protein [Porphyromonas circumdentaria]|uniref:choice-of-anchor D domain-containing protein n=1 Tax=Porphyromonas circumdentaria TaxID=29524 RepID=UPI0026DA93F9|nr:choice-of-anchor D domain-containing protein [Porphyromonas circumdentaria]MDO4722561.1 choice-of-anchor D domain-containing protein [Porphyromonas circumdentaria]
MMKQTKRILLPLAMLLAVAVGLVSCGPDLKKEQEPKNPSIEVNPVSVDFGSVKLNEPAKKEITITGKELADVIKLSLEGANASSFSLNVNELAKEGGKVEVTAKTDSEGDFAAVLKVVSGSISKEVALKSKVVSEGNNDSEVKFSTGEPITELVMDVKFPANYSGLEKANNLYINAKGGAEGEAVELSIEGPDANLFKLSSTKIEDKKKKGTPSGVTTLVFNAQKAGDFKAEVVARYASKTHRLPIKATVVVGKADEIILVEPPLPASNIKANLFGKDLPNGATIKVHTVMVNEGSEYVPKVDLEIPSGAPYRAQASYQKNFQNALQWCMGSACFGQPGDVNPFVYEGEISPGKHHLAFHFPIDELVSGYKNKVTFSFSNGADSYVLYIEFDVD